MTQHDMRLSRRAALKGAAALVIALRLPTPARAQSTASPAAPFAPNAFVRVAADDTVTVLI
jgi:isoquinoline 1-oxidoreductase beta subunit